MDRNLASGIAVILMVTLSLTPACAVTQSAAPKLNSVIIASANANMAALLNKRVKGLDSSADLRGAIVSLGSLFAEMQQSGLNAQLEKQLLAHETEFSTNGLNDEQIQAVSNQVAAAGAKIDDSQFRSALLVNPATRQHLMAQLKKSGLWVLEQQALADLQKVEQNIQPAGLSPSIFIMPFYSLGAASPNLGAMEMGTHLTQVMCETAALAALFALGAYFCPPLAIVSAVYAFEAAIYC